MKGLVLTADWTPKAGYAVAPDDAREHRARLGNMVWKNPVMAVAERPDPVLAGAHDVLIHPRACGICGSDVHLFQPTADGYLDHPYQARLPIAIGHEFAGEVVEVGAGVTRVRPGDLVAVEAQVNCGTCRPCLRGLTSNCENLDDLGFTVDGGTGTSAVAHERHCWPLTAVAERYGAERALDIGALVEPASVVYNGMVNRAGGFAPGDSVAVFGCGPIGLAAVGLAGALGAGRVLAVEPAAAKRAIATELGATATFDPATGDAGQWLLEQTGGVGVDMVIEASGALSRVTPAILDAIAIGAKVVLIGVGHGPIPLDTLALMFRSASLHGSIGHLGGGFPAVIALHAAGRLDLTPMITARFPLDEAVAAMERAAKGEDAKILIHP
jgi:threonine dehydrogenase-like Zn-dependent dehydrogenase